MLSGQLPTLTIRLLRSKICLMDLVIPVSKINTICKLTRNVFICSEVFFCLFHFTVHNNRQVKKVIGLTYKLGEKER